MENHAPITNQPTFASFDGNIVFTVHFHEFLQIDSLQTTEYYYVTLEVMWNIFVNYTPWAIKNVPLLFFQ